MLKVSYLMIAWSVASWRLKLFCPGTRSKPVPECELDVNFAAKERACGLQPEQKLPILMPDTKAKSNLKCGVRTGSLFSD